MNRVWTALAMAALLLGATGCHQHHLAKNGCGNSACGGACGHGGHGHGLAQHGHGHGHGLPAAGHRANVPPPLPHGYQHQVGPAGPATPQVAYPYYTIRGPRDFLLNEPMPLGY